MEGKGLGRRGILVGCGVALVAVAATLAWLNLPADPLPPGTRADRLVVDKAAHRLTAYAGAQELRVYSVALGREPTGAKTRAGDRRTPEGLYRIDGHVPASGFHRALHVSYPGPADIARARAGGFSAGGQIMVHGIRNRLGWIGRAQRLMDWTAGCIALTDPEIEELYRITPDGTPIEIRP
jgi:murein L,D-transpeptidase YafK